MPNLKMLWLSPALLCSQKENIALCLTRIKTSDVFVQVKTMSAPLQNLHVFQYTDNKLQSEQKHTH